MLSFRLPCPPLSVWLLNHMVVPHRRHNLNKYDVWFVTSTRLPNSKVHEANMGPIWGRQDLVGPHVSPMNFVIWTLLTCYYGRSSVCPILTCWTLVVPQATVKVMWSRSLPLVCLSFSDYNIAKQTSKQTNENPKTDEPIFMKLTI